MDEDQYLEKVFDELSEDRYYSELEENKVAFTSFYNRYIKNKGKSTMTKEEAVDEWRLLGNITEEKAKTQIDAVIMAQLLWFKKLKEELKDFSEEELMQWSKDRYPLEALFKFKPM